MLAFTNYGENPNFRVYLESQPAGFVGETGRSVSGLEDLFGKQQPLPVVQSINGFLSIDGSGSATITMVNDRDRLMRKFARQYSDDLALTYLLGYREVWKNIIANNYEYQSKNPYRRAYIDGVMRNNDVTMDQVLKDEIVNAFWFPIFELMQKVWIFFQDVTGQWYHGFTGIITDITLNDPAQGLPTVTLKCQSLWRLLNITQWVTRPSVNPGPELRTALEEKIVRSQPFEVFTTNLQGMSPQDIIMNTIKLLNLYFTLTIDNVQEVFWNETPVLGYGVERGELDIRISTQDLNYGIFKERRVFFDSDLTDKSTVLNIVAEGFKLWRSDYDFPATIFRNIVQMSGYDIYLDEIGNLIIQPPKYDHMPSAAIFNPEDYQYQLPSESDSLGPPDPEVEKLYQKLQRKGTTKYDFFGNKYHGPEYVIGDRSLMNSNLTYSEAPVVTAVEAPSGGFGFMQGAGAGSQGSTDEPFWTGFWGADEITTKRYGVRRRRITGLPNVTDTQLLDAYAEMVAIQINATRLKGNLQFTNRPDLQLGRAMYLIERDLLVYPTRKSFKATMDREVSFNFDWSYGHDPLVPIGVPWLKLDELRGLKERNARAKAEEQSEIKEFEKESKFRANENTDPKAQRRAYDAYLEHLRAKGEKGVKEANALTFDKFMKDEWPKYMSWREGEVSTLSFEEWLGPPV